MFGRKKAKGRRRRCLAHTLEEITASSPQAGGDPLRRKSRTRTRSSTRTRTGSRPGWRALGIGKGDRVAMMLPNIPEFAFSVLRDPEARRGRGPVQHDVQGSRDQLHSEGLRRRAIICLSNFANLINEIRDECPDLEHVIVTGQRTLVFVDPDATVNVQLVVEKSNFDRPTACSTPIGGARRYVPGARREGRVVQAPGRGARARQEARDDPVSEIENLYVVNVVGFLKERWTPTRCSRCSGCRRRSRTRRSSRSDERRRGVGTPITLDAVQGSPRRTVHEEARRDDRPGKSDPPDELMRVREEPQRSLGLHCS
jgi:hypothetical protein